jgi:RanBP-type and C3HC4-type zinc finger-containing protein 1
MRELDRTNEVTLRKKYHLYAESSDTEANNNSSYAPNNNRPSTSRNNKIYQDLSLPNVAKRDSNVPDSVKLEDLNAVTRQHRRTSSDSSKDRKAGSFLHVKNKKKAPPPPPLDLSKPNPKTLSGRRRKRQAPAPPLSPIFVTEAPSAISLLGDKEIQALIQKESLVKNLTTLSSPIVSTAIESPIMEKKKIYVSPYLKIREDRKLTDEQKRILLEQVTKSHRKSDDRLTPINVNTLTKIDFPMAENSKLTKDDKDKVFAPSSPISPRPWYKRSSTNNPKEVIPYKREVLLKTLDKKKKKDEKDLPEVGYSRNSFFDTASKFNIFAKLGEDSKKKDADKRKSLIGIPNISELDREAAEIIQAAQKLSENETTLNDAQSAKDLIHKFEANSSQMNKINLVGDISGREEFFGINKFSFDGKEMKELSGKPPSSPPVKPRNPMNGIRNSPTTKIKNSLEIKIPQSNGIKNSPPVKPKIESTYKSPPGDGLLGLWKCTHCSLENPNWKIICEGCGKIKPYEKRFLVNGDAKKESPISGRKIDKPEGLAWERKSEIVKKYFQPQIPKPMDLSKSSSESFIPKKSPSPTRRLTGSPKMFPRKLSIEKSDTKIEAIKEEENSVLVKTTKTIFTNDNHKNLTPNLNELRNARLARFHTSLDIKRNQSETERQNAIATNRKQSPEKKFIEKLDFSNPIALEREKERLRDKIRAMNAKAFADKYPVKSEIEKPSENVQPETPQNIQESTKLGAIKKVPKKPLEIIESSEEEKIINKEIKNPQKREKISISVQTTIDPRPRKKSEDFSHLPMTVVELTKDEKPDVIEETKLAKTAFNANTMAINKILRNLENAIADGKHDDAAKLAKDLAKLKVPLSVTRQKDRPKSEIDLELSKLK